MTERERLDVLTGFDQPGVDAEEWRRRYYSADERANMALNRAEHFEQVIQTISAAHRASGTKIREFIVDRTGGGPAYDYCPACLTVLSSYGHCANCDTRHDWADERRSGTAAQNQEERRV